MVCCAKEPFDHTAGTIFVASLPVDLSALGALPETLVIAPGFGLQQMFDS
jgi:hypothetical protein